MRYWIKSQLVLVNANPRDTPAVHVCLWCVVLRSYRCTYDETCFRYSRTLIVSAMIFGPSSRTRISFGLRVFRRQNAITITSSRLFCDVRAVNFWTNSTTTTETSMWPYVVIVTCTKNSRSSRSYARVSSV